MHGPEANACRSVCSCENGVKPGTDGQSRLDMVAVWLEAEANAWFGALIHPEAAARR